MNKVNRIVYSRRDFKKESELYAKIAQQIQLLIETNNTVVLKDADEKGGTIVLDFAPRDGNLKPFWLSHDEMICAYDAHIDAEINRANDLITAADAADKAKSIFGDLTFSPADDNGNDGNDDNGGSGVPGAGNA